MVRTTGLVSAAAACAVVPSGVQELPSQALYVSSAMGSTP